MTLQIILTAEEAGHLRELTAKWPRHRLEPEALTDGTFALPLSVRDVAVYAQLAEVWATRESREVRREEYAWTNSMFY